MFAIFSGAHQPFISSKSHWARGVKSNSRGVPTRRISTLSESSRPIGADASGICGTQCNNSFNAASLSANSAISAAISFPISLLRAISGALSDAVGISRVILFFSAVIVCVMVFNSRTRLSNSNISSTWSAMFFTAHAFFTTVGFSRIYLISIIICPHFVLFRRNYRIFLPENQQIHTLVFSVCVNYLIWYDLNNNERKGYGYYNV